MQIAAHLAVWAPLSGLLVLSCMAFAACTLPEPSSETPEPMGAQGSLGDAMGAALPLDPQSRWEMVGHIKSPTGLAWAVDPLFIDPETAVDESLMVKLDMPSEAEVYLETAQDESGYRLNVQVWLRFSDEEPTESELVGTMGVDSGTIAVLLPDQIASRYQVWGDGIHVSLWSAYGTPAEQQEHVIAEAASALESAGFEVRQWLSASSYEFEGLLSETEFNQASEIVRQAGIPVLVSRGNSYTQAQIYEQVAQNGVALLDDRTNPWLIAFASGWGDGAYDWYALKANGQLVGYTARFIFNE